MTAAAKSGGAKKVKNADLSGFGKKNKSGGGKAAASADVEQKRVAKKEVSHPHLILTSSSPGPHLILTPPSLILTSPSPHPHIILIILRRTGSTRWRHLLGEAGWAATRC